MRRLKRRAHRGEVGLVPLRSGCWGIRWGRTLSGDLGLAVIESTGTPDRAKAEQIMRVRELQVAEQRTDRWRLDALRRSAPVVPLRDLASDFLKAYAAGELPGRCPKASTVHDYVCHVLGNRGGLVPFAESTSRATSDRLDCVLVQRWLETEQARRAADDTLRLKRIVAVRLVDFAVRRALIPADRLAAVRAMRAPASARGRARSDGVPSVTEVRELLNALSPAHWRSVAELQLRLGLRASEVLALGADWIDEAGASIHVLVSEGFDTKSHASRIVDGVDAATLALAREVLATKDAVRITLNGYVQAWKRACHQLETAGTPWRYRNKSHALRSLYATQSRLAGVPLNVVRDRMGHESERTTERHYVGRTIEAVPGPFADVPLMSQQPTAATVIPFRRCAS